MLRLALLPAVVAFLAMVFVVNLRLALARIRATPREPRVTRRERAVSAIGYGLAFITGWGLVAGLIVRLAQSR